MDLNKIKLMIFLDKILHKLYSMDLKEFYTYDFRKLYFKLIILFIIYKNSILFIKE